MTVQTDFHAVDQHGTRDFVFQCHKRPFAMTVNPLLPRLSENLIDAELVEFLNIPVKKIEARRFSFAGIETRIVGHISQTVQCVVKGKICGTTHLKAAVVRHMTKLFNLDCVAGGKTFQQLVSVDTLTNKSTIYTNKSEDPVSDKPEDEISVASPRSPVPASATPSPRPRATTPSPTPSSTPSSPTNSASSPTSPDLCGAWGYQGGKRSRFDAKSRRPVDKHWQYDDEDEIWTLPYNKTGPVVKPATLDHTVAYIQLGNEDALTSFCNVVADGWPMVASPKTGTTLTEPSVSPNSPLSTDLRDAWCYQGGTDDRYDRGADCPVDKRWQFSKEEEIWTLPYNRSGPVWKPATPDHKVAYIQLGDEDALTAFPNVVIDGWPKVVSPKTEPTPNISTSASACQDGCSQIPHYQSAGLHQHISSVGPSYAMGHSVPPLPPDFSPCGYYCAYEACECQRSYAGRDWAS